MTAQTGSPTWMRHLALSTFRTSHAEQLTRRRGRAELGVGVAEPADLALFPPDLPKGYRTRTRAPGTEGLEASAREPLAAEINGYFPEEHKRLPPRNITNWICQHIWES